MKRREVSGHRLSYTKHLTEGDGMCSSSSLVSQGIQTDLYSHLNYDPTLTSDKPCVNLLPAEIQARSVPYYN